MIVKPKQGFKTIPQAAVELNCQIAHIRNMLRDEKIPGAIKRPLTANQWRWEIPIEWINNNQGLVGNRSKRPDGRNKLLIWMNGMELEVFQTLMAEHLPDVPWEFAYKRQTPEFEEEEDV